MPEDWNMIMDEKEFLQQEFNQIETFRHKVTEDYDKFIFETVCPYCEKVTQRIIPKELLARALTTYKAEYPEEWNMIMEKYISHTERGIDDEDDN